MDCVTLLLISVLAAFFIYYFYEQKSNLLENPKCLYLGEQGLNNPNPNVFPNCYIPR